ncbi:MAG: phage virion morphogenesis protein [Cyanobacteriota bacterium]|nr:phage virion morphogenesis protein [Cyanobacteriota bacterium]
MVKLITTVTDTRLQQLFDRIDNTLRSPQPLYKAWANHLESRVVNAFKQETSPAGQAWPELKPATIRRKNRNSSSLNKKLRDTGTLYDSIAARALPDGGVVGTNQRVGSYSLGAIHQYGAPQRNIPSRPFLPVDLNGDLLSQNVEELIQLTQDWLNLQP